MTDLSPLNDLRDHLTKLLPVFGNMADQIEELLDTVRDSGAPSGAVPLELLDIMSVCVSAFELLTATAGPATERMRNAVDELLRLHKVN
jgi:hypothetical protein